MKSEDEFFVSARSKRGIFLVVFVALLVVFTPRILMGLTKKTQFSISSEYVKELKTEKRRKQFHSDYQKKSNKFKRYLSPPSKFDPNNYSEKDWMKLGLSKKQADVVLKFAKHGIYSNDQLKKCIVISNELFELIKDSTYFPQKSQQFVNTSTKDKQITLVELNNASQEDLESIPGIGPFYAKNILKHRDKLGGFHHKEQLLEVWKFDAAKLEAIERYIKINPQEIIKLNLNKITVEELKSHPYLGWNIANSIIKLRNQKGGYKSIDEIKESVLIDEELFEKLKPYLSL